eukprot:TRINITY_DN4583_c0_g1_i1.p1 TRINITY_DN4583_c0_g1~~TRINITY_DN4583_c0_g1_i1.p1  ORF type:complete len:750 (-),score=172.40 TRINITY_DN4583_c0_g1_i1:6-2255(-)
MHGLRYFARSFENKFAREEEVDDGVKWEEGVLEELVGWIEMFEDADDEERWVLVKDRVCEGRQGVQFLGSVLKVFVAEEGRVDDFLVAYDIAVVIIRCFSEVGCRDWKVIVYDLKMLCKEFIGRDRMLWDFMGVLNKVKEVNKRRERISHSRFDETTRHSMKMVDGHVSVIESLFDMLNKEEIDNVMMILGTSYYKTIYVKRFDDYVFSPVLSIGKGLSSVYRGFCLITGEHCAVKAIKIPEGLDEKERKSLKKYIKREIDILKNCNDRRVVGLKHVVEDREDETTLLFMELCESDLGSLMKDKTGKFKKLDAATVTHFAREILSCLVYLVMEKNIHHRDVKPENFLVYTDDENIKRLKVADFGLSKIVDPGETVNQSFARVGTKSYMAPEILNEVGVQLNSDLYSVGVILYTMLFGKLPYKNSIPRAQNKIKNIEDGELKSLLEGLFQPYTSRFTWFEIVVLDIFHDLENGLESVMMINNTLFRTSDRLNAENRLLLKELQDMKQFFENINDPDTKKAKSLWDSERKTETYSLDGDLVNISVDAIELEENRIKLVKQQMHNKELEDILKKERDIQKKLKERERLMLEDMKRVSELQEGNLELQKILKERERINRIGINQNIEVHPIPERYPTTELHSKAIKHGKFFSEVDLSSASHLLEILQNLNQIIVIQEGFSQYDETMKEIMRPVTARAALFVELFELHFNSLSPNLGDNLHDIFIAKWKVDPFVEIDETVLSDTKRSIESLTTQ